ncbi:hypothetical protein VNO77_16994 [Canavalia gladiata]|uniref:Uncharacterized protein n=1 Tax=Canavalia gladiata TaxID=3824 RepID=A0AAN9QID2_CANGL
MFRKLVFNKHACVEGYLYILILISLFICPLKKEPGHNFGTVMQINFDCLVYSVLLWNTRKVKFRASCPRPFVQNTPKDFSASFKFFKETKTLQSFKDVRRTRKRSHFPLYLKV